MMIWMITVRFSADFPRPEHSRIMGFYKTAARAQEVAEKIVKDFSGGPGEALGYRLDAYELED